MPSTTKEAGEMSLAEAARALGGLSWPQVYRLILTKRLDARQVRGRWLVQSESVRRLRKARENGGAAVARVGA